MQPQVCKKCHANFCCDCQLKAFRDEIGSRRFDIIARGSQKEFEKKFFDLTKYKVSNRKNGQSRSEVLEKDQILRNCVNPELGLYIFKSAFENMIEVSQ